MDVKVSFLISIFREKKELLEMFHFSLRQGFPSVQFSHSVMSDSATHGLQHNKLARWCSGKESACRCRRCKRHEFSPWVGKMPWRMAWGPTQYSCLENPMDWGAWLAAIHGVAKSQTWLSDWAHTQTHIHTYILRSFRPPRSTNPWTKQRHWSHLWSHSLTLLSACFFPAPVPSHPIQAHYPPFT